MDFAKTALVKSYGVVYLSINIVISLLLLLLLQGVSSLTPLRVHATSLIWKDTNNFNKANLCTPEKEAKNNDRTASVVALVHAHTHILADHVTCSIS